PGNPGMGRTPKVRPLGGTMPMEQADFEELAALFEREKCRFVVVGPEAPLAQGISDALAARGIACLGPSRAAAQLESSKAFAKLFMQRHGIPTAPFEIAHSRQEAHDLLALWPQHLPPPVLKASELWAGKGVVVPKDREEAQK